METQMLTHHKPSKVLVRNTKHSGWVRRVGDQVGIDQKKRPCPIQVDNRGRQFHREQQTHGKDVLSEVDLQDIKVNKDTL